MDEDLVVLGGNIELSGFRELDPGSMMIAKKIIGTSVRRISSRSSNLQKISLNLKKHGAGFQINAKAADNGQVYNSEVSDRNIFFAISKVMDKIESMIR